MPKAYNSEYANNKNNNIYDRDDTDSENIKKMNNHNKDFEEINNKLGSYIDAVRNDISQRQNSQNIDSQILTRQLEGPKDYSMKSLQKDLTTLKLLYDEELRMMRQEIEELSSVKNKYSLDNFNFEVKLQDFFEKFEEIKKVNQQLVDELNETKNKNNRLEFEMESLKIESDKPVRENKQLRKDLEDILKKINEKQEITNSEITYRQELETRYKELLEISAFEKRLLEQEIENYKSQISVTNETIEKLEQSLSQVLKNQEEIAGQKSKKILDLEVDYNDLKSENNKLMEKNEYLSYFCEDLEQIVMKLENVKKTFQIKNTTNSDLDWKNEISKVKINGHEDFRLQMKSPVHRMTQNNQIELNIKRPPSNLGDFCDVEIIKNENKLNDNRFKRNNSSLSNHKNENNIYDSDNSTKKLTRSQIDNTSYLSKNDPTLSSNQNQSPTQLFHAISGTAQSPNNNNKDMKSRASSNCSVRSTDIRAGQINKDYTNEMFKNFEANTFLKKEITRPASSQGSNNNKSVLEASYVGNIKIHEVSKTGSYIRILNTSNTIEEDLGNFTIQQMISAMPVAIYRFSNSVKLAPGRIISVWCNNDEVEQQPPHTFVWKEQTKWGTGPECTTVLAKPNGQAVSWTTGCHTYGNIDTDDLLSVYSPKRIQTNSCQINRKRLVAVFTPTKHPHGRSERSTGIRPKSTQDSLPFYKNTINAKPSTTTINPIPKTPLTQINRPTKSALAQRTNESNTTRVNTNEPVRPKTTMNRSRNLPVVESEKDDEDESKEQIYQENVRYFNQKMPSFKR